jgi:hypothetical protein
VLDMAARKLDIERTELDIAARKLDILGVVLVVLAPKLVIPRVKLDIVDAVLDICAVLGPERDAIAITTEARAAKPSAAFSIGRATRRCARRGARPRA